MQYRIDTKSGNELSALGFGCMRFPRAITGQIDMGKTEKLLRSAIERGVNYFDTAYLYPGSEEALGEIVYKSGSRGKVFLATKLPHGRCKSPGDIDALFKTQLSRLKTDYIDYYLIHNMSDAAQWRRLCGLGIEAWIAEKKASGHIRRIGFSFHGSQSQFTQLLDVYDWDMCQIQYNYMNENYQAGRAGLVAANAKGMPVVIMEPLLGGKLANGLPAKAEKAFRDADGGAAAPAAWALRWLWNQPEVTVVLSGMNGMEQLNGNAETASAARPGMLTQRESDAFGPAVEAFREAYKIPCTGCNYCMPCPQGVNIPGCFAAYNTSYAMGRIAGVQQYITSTGRNNPDKDYSGRKCAKCGACEKKCPQRIPIMNSLGTVTKRMEPLWFRTVLGIIRKFA
ncbi:MAG: aldo/keto reductase [Oscillospiraceae bacterium]|nr:aldo/keto reductase [Oscillospiraceae bacterium]